MTRAFWAACTVLLVLSVPWYLPGDVASDLYRGIPLWCWVTLGCYAAIALLAVLSIERLWIEAAGGDDPEAGPQP